MLNEVIWSIEKTLVSDDQNHPSHVSQTPSLQKARLQLAFRKRESSFGCPGGRRRRRGGAHKRYKTGPLQCFSPPALGSSTSCMVPLALKLGYQSVRAFT